MDEPAAKKMRLDDESESENSLEHPTLQASSSSRVDGGTYYMDFEDECQYKVLDEIVEENDDDSPPTTEDIASDVESLEDDFDIDEIDAMLEENMADKGESSKKSKQNRKKEIETSSGHEVTRIQLVDSDKMSNVYFALPVDWIILKHSSGMPIYFNRKTRACCISRPYVVPSGPVRSHKIPICAIPCLQYKKILEEKEKYSDTVKSDQPNEKNSSENDEVKSEEMVDIQENVPVEDNISSNINKCPYLSKSLNTEIEDKVAKNGDAVIPEIVESEESKTAESEESKTAESGESKTAESGESKTAESGESKTAESGESKTAESGESKTAESGESKTAESGESKTAESEESKTAESGESRTSESEESKTSESEESKTSESEESKTSESGESKTSESGESKTSESEESKTSESEESKTAESEESKTAESEESKTAESEEFKTAEVQESVTAESKETRIVNDKESDTVDTNEQEDNEMDTENIHSAPLKGTESEDSRGTTEGSQESSSGRFANPELAAALNIINKPSHPASTLLPSEGAEVCIVEQIRPVLSVEEFREYCSKLFLFETVKTNIFHNWSNKRRLFRERHIFNEQSKEEETDDAPVTKIITIRNKEAQDFLKKRRSKWVLNPKSKSPVCILHEYVQFVFKCLPEYTYEVLENSATPYAATVKINDLEYATGYGSSKRGAKTQASKETLKIIMPEILDTLEEEGNDGSKFFDTVSLLDPSVPQLCQTMSELPPYSILLNCLKKNNALENAGIKIRVVTKANQKNEFIMSAGKHTVSVTCKNKKEGRQFAAQALLQKLHPHIDTWGSMVRLYGESAYSEIQQKKKEQMEVTSLQNNANPNQPNFSIINLLKKEMLKLAEKRKNMQPLTEFVPPEHVRLPAPSSSNLNTLDF